MDIVSVGNVFINESISIKGIKFPCNSGDIEKLHNRLKCNISSITYHKADDGTVEFYPKDNFHNNSFKC